MASSPCPCRPGGFGSMAVRKNEEHEAAWGRGDYILRERNVLPT